MNVYRPSVYRQTMRRILIPFLCSGVASFAQPQPPPISFTLAVRLSPAAPLLREHRVELHYRYAAHYGYGDHLDGTRLMYVLHGAPLFADSTTGWQRYEIPDLWDTDLRVLVIAGTDTMQMAVPDTGADRYALIERAWMRWDRATPEVIHFRKGRYAFAEVISGSTAEVIAGHFADRLITEEDIRYKEGLEALEEYYRNLPPAAPPTAPYIPPPPMTEAEWAAFWAEQPPLQQARIEEVRADTVTIAITGRIMLTGGCSSDMPLFGLEMWSDTGWVERLPLDLAQMDCGMPWGDWQDHRITVPLAWWVANFSPHRKELFPGTYRFVFTGGNMQAFRTAAFTIDP